MSGRLYWGRLSSQFIRNLPDLLEERGQAIHSGPRRHIERLLASDFADVVVHTSRRADVMNRELGARAFTLGNHICFSEGAYDPHSEPGLRLLAHELAHVAQQRLGIARGNRSPSPTSRRHAMEVEADLAADKVLTDQPYACRIADGSRLPACWDIAGHYYTPYLIFLNAGVDPEEARGLARSCWLPDQVSEFDAKTIAIHSFGIQWNGGDEFHDRKNYRDNFESRGQQSFRDHEHYVTVVHKGLHSLTGGNALTETDRRAEIFSNSTSDALLYRGLALHAFGDCFAHRRFGLDSMVLYPPGLGHAPSGAADEIWHPGRGSLYIAYVRRMAELAQKYSANLPKVPIDDIIAALSAMVEGTLVFTGGADNGRKHVGVTWSKVSKDAKRLSGFAVDHTEAACSAHICRIAQELVGRPLLRIDEQEPVPWERYCNSHTFLKHDAGLVDTGDIFYNIMKHASDWSKEGLVIGAKLEPVRPRRRVS